VFQIETGVAKCPTISPNFLCSKLKYDLSREWTSSIDGGCSITSILVSLRLMGGRDVRREDDSVMGIA